MLYIAVEIKVFPLQNPNNNNNNNNIYYIIYYIIYIYKIRVKKEKFFAVEIKVFLIQGFQIFIYIKWY